MRKHILTRLRSLFGRAKAEPLMTNPVSEPQDRDTWLFDTDAGLDAPRSDLAREMSEIAHGLSDLRETLARVHSETPYPTETRVDTQCAIVHHDDMLFDGEVDAPFVPAQEEVSGGAGMFLFDDAPTFQDDLQEQHQHAA